VLNPEQPMNRTFVIRLSALALAAFACASTAALAQRGGGGGRGRGNGLQITPQGQPLDSLPDYVRKTAPTDPMIFAMWQEGTIRSQAATLSQALFDSIGPRLTGSPGMKAASDWVISTYRKWGITAKAEQYGTWNNWRRGVTHVDLVAPRVRTLEATMRPWSPGTNNQAVEGEVLVIPDVPDSAAFTRWLPKVKGNFVLMNAAPLSCRAPDTWTQFGAPESYQRLQADQTAQNQAYAQRQARALGTGGGRGGGAGGGRAAGGRAAGRGQPPDSAAGGRAAGRAAQPPDSAGRGGRAAGGAGAGGGARAGGGGAGGGAAAPTMPQRLAAAGAAGVLAISWSNLPGVNKVLNNRQTPLPTFEVICEDYGLLYRLAMNNQGPRVRVQADAQFLGELPVFNTIATIRGSQKPDEYIVLSAHFDSWDGASGAVDNGTGTITMMEAIRIVKTVYGAPKRTIVVGHWSGEEEGLIGSHAFSEDHPEIVKGMHAFFNQDNGTGRVVSMSPGGLGSAGAVLKGYLSQMPRDITQFIRFNEPGNPSTGGTDNASFACYGVPAFGLSSLGWDYEATTHHTNRDTYDKVVMDDLKHNATLTAMLVYLADNDPVMMPRDKGAGVNFPAGCTPTPNRTSTGRGGAGGGL
jgi:hypothetical protein